MQTKQKIELYSRNIERLLLSFVTLIMGVMVFSYYTHIKDTLNKANEGYGNGNVVNLAAPLNEKSVKALFVKGGYFTDAAYSEFIAKELKAKVEEQKRLPNLGALNKKPLLLPATDFLAVNSEAGTLRFVNSLVHLGMDSSLYAQERSNPQDFPSEIIVGKSASGLNLKGSVALKNESDANSNNANILIKLTRIYPDAYFDSLPENAPPVQTEFYTRTDERGNYLFKDVDTDGSYSVLAIKPGYEFGETKGVVQMSNSIKLNFVGKPHQLKLFDRIEYKQIKNDKIFTVRTPVEFEKDFFTCIGLFIVGFWILHIALFLKNYRSDQFILPLIMLILGIGIMTLYGAQDPLRDEVYGSGMAKYAFVVLLIFSIAVFAFKQNPVNTFYNSTWFDPVYKWLPFTNKLKSPRGYTWLIISIVLMLLLSILGTGPEGSGVKVNLWGFQVSELSKFLMVMFFATYFTVNAGYFRNIPDNRWLTKNNLLMITLFAFLILIYAILGDLGPAVVLCLTFLFFYSFAKNEFLEMIVTAVVLGALLLLTAKFLNTETHNFLPWVSFVACVATFLYAFFKKKQETAFFITLIISSFVLLATLPFSFTQRLADRNDMFSNIWENKLVGGDQVAHGVWALNAGGFTGQGLGNSFANVMPAHHTDMILETIGEELGILTLIAVFLAFGLLMYRCILAARRTGKPFMFYLMTGISIATILQFALIAAGTLGLLPLTGISVPFLSKGNAGIILTLIAFLFVLIMSNERGDAQEMEYVKKNFDNVNTYAVLTFFVIVLVFSATLLWYQVKSNEYIVKPALVLNKKGEWQYSYNPRIGLIFREIQSGNIYDRNGVLLATSNKEEFLKSKSKLIAQGANAASYNQQLTSTQNRYYPFGSDLLFWLGDYNKEIAREENIGYAAEYRHFTTLRGFDITNSTTIKTTDRYKENKFLPEIIRENELTLYDYSVLAPLIKAGKNGDPIKMQNKMKKDIWLSLDIAMNQKINTLIQTQAPYNAFRTSVVAINSKTGDVLASASNPSPSYKDLKLISNIDPGDYRTIFKQIFNDKIVVPQDLGITYTSRPGSTVKIIDAYAAINQYGLGAANFSFFVYPAEVIRSGEPSNQDVDMHQAIVHSSNVYFIKLLNEKKLQSSVFDMYDKLGMNIKNRGGFTFGRPANYNTKQYFENWNEFVSEGKGIYYSKNKNIINTRRRFYSNYSNIAWGQGELMATPLHLAKMSGAIANRDSLQPSRFLYKSWKQVYEKQSAVSITKFAGAANIISGFMKEQSAKVAAATGLQVYGKTGSPERDKLIQQNGKTIRKRVTDAWYTFYVPSSKYNAPIAFAIRIEGIGNSESAKQLAIDMLKQLKNNGYF